MDRKKNQTVPSSPPKWAIRPTTPDDVYTDRAEHLEYLYEYALAAITRRSMSTVLLGQRRMGKTEIFKRVVNKLFFEQENHSGLHSTVVPVFYSFAEIATDPWQFAEKYVENFLRWYAAFRLKNPTILSEKVVGRTSLVEIMNDKIPQSTGLKGSLNLFNFLLKKDVTDPIASALTLPRFVSDWDDSSVVVFLDEFQNTRLPQFNFDIVGLMQEAVESPTCPHFVTGSAMSILAAEILGSGSLFGRFRTDPISPLTEYWGSELALRSARFYRALVPEEMAPVVSARCGGNPFYITAVIQQSVMQNKPLRDEEKINEILAVDLSSGFIWGELSDQVERWIARINEYGITKWVLYLSALEQGEEIDLERIQKELYERDRQNVSVETIRNVLIKLSRGDLLEYVGGGWFRKTEDPILLEFLKVWGKIIVERQNQAVVKKNIVTEYQTLKRKIHDHLGYLGEVYMGQILWNGQRQTIPGRFFHSSEDIKIPDSFIYIWHRTRLGAALDMEIDVEAAAGTEMWICESKWWKDKKASVREVKSLLIKAGFMQKREGPGLKILKVWFFAYDGFTPEAESLMKENGFLWSDRADLDSLLIRVGLKKLPEV